MAVDWTDRTLSHSLEVQMLDPSNKSDVLGYLDVSVEGCTVSEDLLSETLASATLSVPDWSQWVDGSWIRIVHRCGGFSEDLFTGYVWDEGESLEHDHLSARPALRSAVGAFSANCLEASFTVGEGASCRSAIEAVLARTQQEWRISAGFADYRFQSTRMWDAGTGRLGLLLDLCELCGAGVSVDGDGCVVVSRAVDPSTKGPVAALLSDDPLTLVLASGLRRSGNRRQVAGRSVVWFRDGDNQISGYAEVGQGNQASPSRRGYTIDVVHQLDDMPEPRTPAHAAELATRYLSADSAASRDWEMRTLWFPVRAGDVVDFAPPGGDARRCQVIKVEKNLRSWTLSITAREV